jgi:DNA gyrase/topoisomerase IV subunit A
VESVIDDYDLIITSKGGQVIRISADSIRITGRVSQGVKAIDLRDGDSVQDAVALPSMMILSRNRFWPNSPWKELPKFPWKMMK